MFYIGVVLIIGIGIAHSYLGERYILMRLFRRDNLPKLFGGAAFTKNTLRFAWHITTLAWFGFAAILFYLAGGQAHLNGVGNIVGATFILHFLVALIGSNGKHFSWPIFLVVGVTVLYASNT